MAIDRTGLRATAALERRPSVSSKVQRRASEIQRSPALTLQQRIGNHATQILIARSIASQSKETEGKKKQQDTVNVASPTSVQHSKWIRLPGKVSKAYDAAELEAEETTSKVMSMQTLTALKQTAT